MGAEQGQTGNIEGKEIKEHYGFCRFCKSKIVETADTRSKAKRDWPIALHEHLQNECPGDPRDNPENYPSEE